MPHYLSRHSGRSWQLRAFSDDGAFFPSPRLPEAIMRFDEPKREELTHYAQRPLAFLGRYIRRRSLAHAAILVAVLIAVGCSVGAQYGLKSLVDALSGPRAG